MKKMFMVSALAAVFLSQNTWASKMLYCTPDKPNELFKDFKLSVKPISGDPDGVWLISRFTSPKSVEEKTFKTRVLKSTVEGLQNNLPIEAFASISGTDAEEGHEITLSLQGPKDQTKVGIIIIKDLNKPMEEPLKANVTCNFPHQLSCHVVAQRDVHKIEAVAIENKSKGTFRVDIDVYSLAGDILASFTSEQPVEKLLKVNTGEPVVLRNDERKDKESDKGVNWIDITANTGSAQSTNAVEGLKIGKANLRLGGRAMNLELGCLPPQE